MYADQREKAATEYKRQQIVVQMYGFMAQYSHTICIFSVTPRAGRISLVKFDSIHLIRND